MIIAPIQYILYIHTQLIVSSTNIEFTFLRFPRILSIEETPDRKRWREEISHCIILRHIDIFIFFLEYTVKLDRER